MPIVTMIRITDVATRMSQETGRAIDFTRIWNSLKRHPEWNIPVSYERTGRHGRPAASIPEDYYETLKAHINP